MAEARPREVPAPPAEEKAPRRRIPGNMPYTGSPGVLQRVLEKIPTAEKPTTFSQDFLTTVLGITGGSSRPIVPILKATGLLNQGGVPTELYAQFQTERGRPASALQALRAGYSEIFKRNQYAHRAEPDALTDVIVAITGLPRTDTIVRYILNTFQTFQSFARTAPEEIQQPTSTEAPAGNEPLEQTDVRTGVRSAHKVGLVYNINVVLPETTNIEVYNAIFRSLRTNML